MDSPLISIIIPVYNLQDYVVAALDSIYSQNVDLNQFEVVVVDDCSKDNSLNLIKDYAKGKSNLKCISQKNSGVSIARNSALDKACGQYVTFLDADDEFYPESLPSIISFLSERKDFDLLYCRSFVIGVDGQPKESHLWQQSFKEDVVYNGKDLLSHHYNNGGSVCGGIYKREYLEKNNMRFGEKIANGEDTIFNYILYAHNPKVLFSDIKLNKVCVREGSASNSYSPDKVTRFRNNILYLQKLRKSREWSDDIKRAIDIGMYHSISLATNMFIELEGRSVSYMHDLLDIKHLWWLRPKWVTLDVFIKMELLNISYWAYFKLIKIKLNNKNKVIKL